LLLPEWVNNSVVTERGSSNCADWGQTNEHTQGTPWYCQLARHLLHRNYTTSLHNLHNYTMFNCTLGQYLPCYRCTRQ